MALATLKTKQVKIDATTPFYAAVGAGDLAVERLRKVVLEVQERLGEVDLEPQVLATTVTDQARAQLTARVEALVGEAKEAQTRLQTRAAELQADVLALPKTAQTQAQARVGALQSVAGAQVSAVKGLPATVETRLAELQAELKALPGRVEALLAEVQSDVKGLPGKAQARVTELQDEAKALVAKLETRAAELRSELEGSFAEQVEALSTFATRGESRIAKLRDDSIAGDVEIIDHAAQTVKAVADEVEEKAAAAAEAAQATVTVTTTTPRKTTTRTGTTRKKAASTSGTASAEKKAPVRKTTPRKTTTRTTAKKSATSKAPGSDA